MQLPVPVRRLIYRIGYRVLQVTWRLGGPGKTGVKCLLTDQDRILLVRHTYGNRAWDLPGGGVRRGEPPLDAARREIREELGVDSLRFTALGALHGMLLARHETIHCFGAELTATPITIDRGELAAATWFARDALPATLAPHVRLLLRHAPPPAPAARRVEGESPQATGPGASSQATGPGESSQATGPGESPPAKCLKGIA